MTKPKPGAVRNRPWTDADIATMRAMHAAGASSREIAAVLHRSKRAVSDRRRVLGLLQDEATRRANIAKGMSTLPHAHYVEAGRKAGSSGWTPERREQARRLMTERMQRPEMRGLGIAAIKADPAILERRKAAMIETKVGHCPPAYRAERTKLVRNFGAVVADQMIAEQIAADKRRASIAEAKANGWSMAFQAQLERVRGGVEIVNVMPMRRADHEFSLTGGSLA